MPHDAFMFAGLLYTTDPFGADYSDFEPMKIWSQLFTWMKGLPGFENTKIPDGWSA